MTSDDIFALMANRMCASVFLCFKGSSVLISITVNISRYNPVGITEALAFPIISKSAKKS